MRAPLVLVATLALPGCFTSWVIAKAAGAEASWRDTAREERVPLPGIQETLVVSLPFTDITPSSYHFQCEANQLARDAVYTSATRYGRSWKVATATMFVTEAAIGAAFLLTAKENQPGPVVVGAFFAIDALGTAALFFAPRKDSYDRSEAAITTGIRSVCPEGLILEIAGDAYPINAAGTLGEFGDIALDAWMREASGPGGQLVVTFQGHSSPLDVGDAERCTWTQAREPSTNVRRTYCPGLPRYIAARFELPVGTLAQVP